MFWFRGREPQGEPTLRIAVHQNARDFLIDPDEFVADSVRAIDAAKQAFEFFVRNRLLEFFERLPVWRIRQRIAQMVGRPGGNAEEEGEGEED